MSDLLNHEFHYFIDHQDELVKEYNGKIVAIKGNEVLGGFDTYVEAIEEITKTHPLGTFLLQYCEPGPDCYTFEYHGYMPPEGAIIRELVAA